jgi:hypothetical protein
MVSQVVLLALGFVLTSRLSPVFADGCVVSPQMGQGQKMPCLRESHVMLDQPTLTLEQLTKGPDFDPADPVKSRFLYVTPNDTLTCYFRPHFAFIRDKGQSLKFLCWQMAGPNAFFDRTGNKIDVDDVKVVISKDPGGESRAHLFAKSDSANANEIKADSFKVKYLSPPFPNHEKRLNEVFTEVAATRLLWALGFPADHMYSAGAVRCIGCGSDPFKDNLKDNKSSLKDGATTFRVVAIERLLPMEPIEASNDETWAWQDAHALYSSGWTREQQVGFDAYRLALGMLAYHNPLDSQNRLACAEWKQGADNPKVCAKPVILVQDIGSTFGKPGSFGNSRGDFGDWQGQRVFANAERCELKYPLKGSPTVLKEAQDQLVKRLDNLTRDKVKAIFASARFGEMDQRQVSRLRKDDGSNTTDAALNEWTDAFMARAAEIRAARKCRP